MKAGIVGPTYQETSRPFDWQRSVNFYPVFDQNGKEVSAMYGTPGLTLFADNVGPGVNRQHFPSAATGRAFAIIGAVLYEINADGSSVNRGALNSSFGICSMDENPFQLAINDGFYTYIFTYATNVFIQAVTPAPLTSITFIDSFFVGSGANGQFFKSASYDGTTWAALDFATAESSPDGLVRVMNAVGQLWLMGTKTTEIWTDTGAAKFPFAKIAGAVMATGILAGNTAVPVDNTIFWVGADKDGNGIVYRARGFSAQRISTSPIEYILQAAPDPTNLRAYTYQRGGRTFYVITGGGMLTSPVYDISTQMWHERCFLNDQGDFESHLGVCSMFAFGQQLVGDRTNSNIYFFDDDNFTDNGSPMASDRIFTNLSDEGKYTRYNALNLGFETGIGNQNDPGKNPKVSMRLSKDGARTWSNWYEKTLGEIGQYTTNVVFRRLGIVQQMTFHIRITDPVARRICGAYLS